MPELISVIVPVYNEVDSLPDLTSQLQDVLKRYERWEVLFIDDGSTDGSTEYLKELVTAENPFTLIQFYRNYGKAAALDEGFKRAEGDYVVTLDADLQDDPVEIPNLIAKLEEGYDLVSGWKKVRHDPWTKTFPSKIFNTVTRFFTRVKIHDFNCGLKIYRKAVIKSLEIYGGRHRYIPALAGQKKFRVSEIPVNHRRRIHGKTKYGGARLLHGFFDLLTILFLNRYTQQPLHLFGTFGLAGLSFGSLIEAYVLYLKYILGEPFSQHVALLILGVMIIVVGVQFMAIGLLGEMIARTQQNREDRVKQVLE